MTCLYASFLDKTNIWGLLFHDKIRQNEEDTCIHAQMEHYISECSKAGHGNCDAGKMWISNQITDY